MAKQVGGSTSPKPMLLSEAIDIIKEDLVSSAQLRPENWEPIFEINEAEVEINVRFERDIEVGGKIKVFVTEIGASGSEKSEVSHKISLKLKPLPQDDDSRERIKNRMKEKDPYLRG